VTIACTREFLSTELGLVQLLNIINNLLPTDELHLANSAILVILVLYIWELLPSLSNCLLVYMLCGFENVFYKVLVVVNKSDAKEPFLLCLECAHISIGY
jgi:ABC-type multidrug transport system permease subunit